MIWIVSGPSSAGKSTILRTGAASALTGLPATTRVWHPRELEGAGPAGGEDAYVHYNILRTRRSATSAHVRAFSDWDAEPMWQAVLALSGEKRAIVVVADRATLLQRAVSRANGRGHARVAAVWRRLYTELDVADLYSRWRRELERRSIGFIEVDGSGVAYAKFGQSERSIPQSRASAATSGA